MAKIGEILVWTKCGKPLESANSKGFKYCFTSLFTGQESLPVAAFPFLGCTSFISFMRWVAPAYLSTIKRT